MSYANGTPFINLPQTVGTDKRDWADTNEAFLDLDAKLKSAYEGSINTADALAALAEVVSGLSTDVSGLVTTVGNHTTSIQTINEALTLINNALISLNSTMVTKFDSAGIADPYDAEHGTYSVDDVVTYNGQRYVCHTAVTAAEPFDADKWTAKDLQTEIDDINSALSDKIEIINIVNEETETTAGDSALTYEIPAANIPAGKTVVGINVVGTTPKTSWDTIAHPQYVNVATKEIVLRTIGATSQKYRIVYDIFLK